MFDIRALINERARVIDEVNLGRATMLNISLLVEMKRYYPNMVPMILCCTFL